MHFAVEKMYKYLYFIIVFLGIQRAVSQTHEIGAFIGGSNPISDIGRTYYVFPNKLAYGGLYKWNFHNRVLLRFQLSFTELRANDIQSDVEAKAKRQFAYSNEITEFTLGLEYNFFKFDMHKRLDKPVTPYLFTGVTYFHYDDLYINKNITSRPLEAQPMAAQNKALAIPVILGVKAKVSVNFVVAAEVGTRFAFTNNIDGSSPQHQELAFGNKTVNDFYIFSGFTITYTFGRKPCYCD